MRHHAGGSVRGGSKANHRLVYHPTLGWRVSEKRMSNANHAGGVTQPARGCHLDATAWLVPLASEKRKTEKGLEDFHLKAKARIWP